MTISQDFLTYHKSIGQELKTSESRIRNLIGNSHWLTDGEHKESILRKVITDFSPEIFRIGTGFVCYPTLSNNSGQIDILVTSKNNPTLYKSGELHFVTPECVGAIIEVKTKLSKAKLKETLVKLSKEISLIRKHGICWQSHWAGLFVYNSGTIKPNDVLEILQEITNNDHFGVINCVSIGEDLFIRFWEDGHPSANIGTDPVWHSYNLRNLSHAYFISNLVSHLSPLIVRNGSEAWFPISGTKEINKLGYAKLSESKVFAFEG